LKIVNFKEGELKMKKLLVLFIVLGLAASAQAALTLSLSATTVAVNGEVTFSVISDDTTNWIGDAILSENVGAWSDPIAASYVGNWAWTVHAGDGAQAPYTQVGVARLAAGGTTVLPTAGTQFSVNIKGVQAGTIYVDLQDDSTFAEMANGPLTLVVTPEPITMALLGLGGLFLRRRK
jgi:hypothetical protein